MRTLALLLLVLAPLAQAQLCGANGGNASLSSSPLALGKTATIRFSGNPGALALLYYSDAPAALTIPGVGTICLDIGSALFDDLITGAFPASGELALPVAIPNDPALLGFNLYLQGIAADAGHPSGFALTAGLRAEFEVADSYEARPNLAATRALATATRGGDGRILIAGGGAGSLTAPTGTSSVEIYDPFTRTFNAGAAMSVVRALHTATALADGRILVVGGVADNVTSVATAGGEIFDPFTGAWSPIAPMSVARAGHAAELLADGRVLVVGGTPSFAGGGTALGPVLNATWNTGEVYDPATDSWTAVSNTMADRRLLPTATRMNDGRVLVVSGLSGATSFFGQDLPTWTSSVQTYDPTSNSFVAVAGIGSSFARAGAAATLLDNGDVVVAGGVVSGLLSVPTSTNSVRIFRGGTWIAGPALPEAVGVPGLATLDDGSVLFVGGITGDLLAPGASSAVARLSGGAMTSVAGLSAARGAQVTIALDDGGVLIAGGADAAALPVADAQVYTPDL